jgi:hypothetical protein
MLRNFDDDEVPTATVTPPPATTPVAPLPPLPEERERPLIPVESLLRARTLDPATSHVAMSEVKPGKIIHFANIIYEMLDRHSVVWARDEYHTDEPVPGLTDWQMTMLLMDVGNPATAWLQPLRDTYMQTHSINVRNFVQMGRLWLSRSGYVLDVGVRRNEHVDASGGRYSARKGIIWHRPAVPGPPIPPASPYEQVGWQRMVDGEGMDLCGMGERLPDHEYRPVFVKNEADS